MILAAVVFRRTGPGFWHSRDQDGLGNMVRFGPFGSANRTVATPDYSLSWADRCVAAHAATLATGQNGVIATAWAGPRASIAALQQAAPKRPSSDTFHIARYL